MVTIPTPNLVRGFTQNGGNLLFHKNRVPRLADRRADKVGVLPHVAG